MKKNNKGFLLVETLVVSTFCLTVLVILFLQFRTLILNYNTSFKYNTVEGIYNLGVIKKYFQEKNISFVDPTYVYKCEEEDVSSCDDSGYDVLCDDFCKAIVSAEDIKVLIYTGSNIHDSLKGNALASNSHLSNGMKSFISQLKSNDKGSRLIAEFKDGTYTSITYRNRNGGGS